MRTRMTELLVEWNALHEANSIECRLPRKAEVVAARTVNRHR